MANQAFDLEVYEDHLTAPLKHKIKLPAVPRVGEVITLPDAHYMVKDVYWQANVPEDPGPGYEWPDSVYYTIRLVVNMRTVQPRPKE